jgi:hypothetical protein
MYAYESREGHGLCTYGHTIIYHNNATFLNVIVEYAVHH